MISISTATIADIPSIRTLAMQVWPQTYVPIIGEQQVAYMLGLFYSPEALTKQMQEQEHQFILCFDNGVSVAFAAYSEVEPHVFKLHKIYLLPSCQGKGIGSKMLGYIVDDIRGKGATELRLNVNIYNKQAIAFYAKAGFEHYKDEDIDIGNGYFMNDHVLSLNIAAAQ